MVSLQSLSDLTHRERQIVTALTQPMTSSELINHLSLSPTYTQKCLYSLQEKGFVQKISNGNTFTYHTIRYHATEELFKMRAASTGKVNEYLVPWDGQLRSLLSVGQIIQEEFIKARVFGFFKFCIGVLYKLRVNGLYIGQKQPTERPYSEELRQLLEKRIQQEERILTFAKAIYEAPIWRDDDAVTKLISEDTVTNQEKKDSRIFFDKLLSPKGKK